MKLYTEEQVRMILDNLQTHVEEKFDYYIDEVIDEIIPIELPSDEEMDKFLLDNSYEYGYGYRDAIDWIKKQILNQNK